MYTFILYFYYNKLCSGVNPSSTHRIAPDDAEHTIWDISNKIQVDRVQGKYPVCFSTSLFSIIILINIWCNFKIYWLGSEKTL